MNRGIFYIIMLAVAITIAGSPLIVHELQSWYAGMQYNYIIKMN